MPPQPSKHPKLAELFRLLSYFRPEMEGDTFTGRFLVNEKNPHPYDHPIDSHFILNMIGEASLEFMQFIRAMAAMQSEHAGLKELVTQLGGMLKFNLPDIADNNMATLNTMVAVMGSRYAQMIGFIRHVANDIPTDKCKAAAEDFLSFKPERFHLVNYDHPNNARVDENLPTTPKEDEEIPRS